MQDAKNQLRLEKTAQQQFNDLIDKLQQDKKRLGLRVNKLTATGQWS